MPSGRSCCVVATGFVRMGYRTGRRVMLERLLCSGMSSSGYCLSVDRLYLRRAFCHCLVLRQQRIRRRYYHCMDIGGCISAVTCKMVRNYNSTDYSLSRLLSWWQAVCLHSLIGPYAISQCGLLDLKVCPWLEYMISILISLGCSFLDDNHGLSLYSIKLNLNTDNYSPDTLTKTL